MEIVLVVVIGIKKSMAILKKDLKNIIFKSTEDKDWLKK